MRRDACYVLPEAQDTVAVTFWMPLCSTNARNGTMQYIRGGHIDAHRDQSLRALPRVVDGGRTLEHLHEPGWNEETQRNGTVTGFMTIPEDNLPTGEVVTVDVEQGEMIVTSNIMPHRSLPNWSREMRWSCDWRVQDMRLPHGWASNADGGGGGCYQLTSDDPSFVPDWECIPGPPAADCALHPYSWIDEAGTFHRH